tara:strand:- start:16 stop:1161 length:1146 start_codon:yes stop_codon:yes gene_type:complete
MAQCHYIIDDRLKMGNVMIGLPLKNVKTIEVFRKDRDENGGDSDLYRAKLRYVGEFAEATTSTQDILSGIGDLLHQLWGRQDCEQPYQNSILTNPYFYEDYTYAGTECSNHNASTCESDVSGLCELDTGITPNQCIGSNKYYDGDYCKLDWDEFSLYYIHWVIGAGLGIFATPSGWSGNLNNLIPTSGYWISFAPSNAGNGFSGRTWSATESENYLKLTGECYTLPADDSGININILPSAVQSVNGYENNLFSYIPANQENLPLNADSTNLSPLQEYLYEDCESNNQQLIPGGTILYTNISYQEPDEQGQFTQEGEADNYFFNTSAYYNGSTWSTTSAFNSLLVNKAYNIQFPANFTGCFRFDDPFSGLTDDDVIDDGGVG